jgi:hypothetical protein
MSLLPTVPLGDTRITRLICGGNPFRGNSHQSAEMGRQMQEYFTVSRIKETLHACERAGINTLQARGDVLIQAIVREFRAEGGTLNWIVQTASELRGTWVDNQFRQGRESDVLDLLKTIRDQGVVTGLGSHRPDIIAHACEKAWDVDFFMCSMYNLSRTERESALVSAGAQTENELFIHDDKWAMLDVIRQTDKTCLAFKVLGAGRLCQSPDQVRQAFETVYHHIKPKDAVVVGMWPRDRDQAAENAQFVREILCTMESPEPAASRPQA